MHSMTELPVWVLYMQPDPSPLGDRHGWKISTLPFTSLPTQPLGFILFSFFDVCFAGIGNGQVYLAIEVKMKPSRFSLEYFPFSSNCIIVIFVFLFLLSFCKDIVNVSNINKAQVSAY